MGDHNTERRLRRELRAARMGYPPMEHRRDSRTYYDPVTRVSYNADTVHAWAGFSRTGRSDK